jgi:hypothetical protein
MDGPIPFGSREYIAFAGLLFLTRGLDVISTWIATPNLVLEGNPVAKTLGWRFGILANLAICAIFGAWPLTAIVISTTSVLVAARNFQMAWLMNSFGEEEYRSWFMERLEQSSLPLYFLCLLGQVLPTAALGSALMYFSQLALIPFGIGLGIVAYSFAVLFFTMLSLWRVRRAMG